MAGRVFKRGATYHVAFSYQGVEYRKSALTEKKREAENLLAFYLGQCARGEFRGFQETATTYTLCEMLDDCIANYEQCGLRDVQVTRWRSNNLRRFFKDIPVAAITERKVDLYIKHRLAAGKTRTTINRTEVPYMEKFSEKGNERQGFFEREELEKIVAFLETVAALPGLVWCLKGPVSYSCGPNMRARRTQRCSVRGRIDAIPARG